MLIPCANCGKFPKLFSHTYCGFSYDVMFWRYKCECGHSSGVPVKSVNEAERLWNNMQGKNIKGSGVE